MSERDERQRARAAALGQQGWGSHGSASAHARYAHPVRPQSRARCSCGCKTRATHVGMANGVALMSGCEWAVAQWVRDPHWQHKRDRAQEANR